MLPRKRSYPYMQSTNRLISLIRRRLDVIETIAFTTLKINIYLLFLSMSSLLSCRALINEYLKRIFVKNFRVWKIYLSTGKSIQLITRHLSTKRNERISYSIYKIESRSIALTITARFRARLSIMNRHAAARVSRQMETGESRATHD